MSCNNGLNVPDGGDGGLGGLYIMPPSATLVVAPGISATQQFRVMRGQGGAAQDVTAQALMTVVDGTLGSIQNGLFTSSPIKGGSTQITAMLPGTDLGGSATVTVKLSGIVIPSGTTGLPPNPSASFVGTPDPTRAPTLVYPNDGVLLPPNLSLLEVDYLPGSAKNTLFEIDFSGPYLDLKTYALCPNPTSGGCILQLDQSTYTYVTQTSLNGSVQLTVRGGDAAATGFGVSATRTLLIAPNDVEGGLYYWTTSGGTAIMRVDFGSVGQTPSVFLSPSQNGFPTCIGCHALSRDGTKMVASLGGQNDGRIVYLPNIAMPTDFALDGDTANAEQFASFSPDGSLFVSVYGDTDNVTARQTLRFHNGTTGVINTALGIPLSFEPDHPDWSPDGTMIAMTHVGIHQTSQRPFNCGVDVMTQSGGQWQTPVVVVPRVNLLSRYNPNFAPDSSFFIYSESTCPNNNNMDVECDADSDDSAKTWAVLPKAGATPVLLAKAAAPGTMDGTNTDLCDTFARFAPFPQTYQGSRISWVTMSSRRWVGLRQPINSGDGSNEGELQMVLWMFAVDPDKVAQGQDGSYPAFFLPFQDLTTSNHIGQWTAKIVPPLG